MTVRFFLLIIPAVSISAFVFLVFGFLGLCAMSVCLGSSSPGTEQKLVGAALVVAASLPLLASATVLLSHYRKKHLGTRARILIWTVILIAGALGVFQVLIDPGDAIWAGVPLIVFSALLAGSTLISRNQ